MGREWIKLNVKKWLFGSMAHELTDAQVGVWSKLLALAEIWADGKRSAGTIPLELESIRHTIHSRRSIFEGAINRLKETNRIELRGEKELFIVNFSHYNPSRWEVFDGDNPSDHKARQQRYREKQRTNNNKQRVTTPDNDDGLERELELYKETTKESFQNYLNSLRPKYPSLDVDAEWEACQLWWSEGKKQMKRPKSALLNWLKRAEQMRQVNKPKTDLPRLEIDKW